MVGRGDDDGVDVLAVEQFAIVADGLGIDAAPPPSWRRSRRRGGRRRRPRRRTRPGGWRGTPSSRRCRGCPRRSGRGGPSHWPRGRPTGRQNAAAPAEAPTNSLRETCSVLIVSSSSVWEGCGRAEMIPILSPDLDGRQGEAGRSPLRPSGGARVRSSPRMGRGSARRAKPIPRAERTQFSAFGSRRCGSVRDGARRARLAPSEANSPDTERSQSRAERSQSPAPREANFLRRAKPNLAFRSPRCGTVQLGAGRARRRRRRAKPMPGAERTQSRAPSKANSSRRPKPIPRAERSQFARASVRAWSARDRLVKEHSLSSKIRGPSFSESAAGAVRPVRLTLDSP